MDPLVARIRRTVRRFSLLPAGSRVLVAVSGGTDSMALLDVMRELHGAGEVRLAGVAHLNHGLRGEAAALDEEFCRTAAESSGLPFDCERVDVRAIAAERRVSIEAAGHFARYDFFQRAATRLGAERVALGHTRDDQAETFLLRLLRGAGPRGLSGMHPRVGQFVRPMLECSRAEIRHFVARRGIRFREDDTNRDVMFARNAVRHELLPQLARLSPAIVRVLSREAALARDDAEFLEATAAAAAKAIIRDEGAAIALDAAELGRLPAAIGRRVIRVAASRLADTQVLTFDQVERVRDLISDGAPGDRVVNLPGQRVEFDGSCVLFKRDSSPVRVARRGAGRPGARSRTTGGPRENFSAVSLSIPGEVVLPVGWAVSAERSSAAEEFRALTAASPGGRMACPRSWALVEASTVASPLTVRGWTAGDRFRPLGMTGTRKLQDFLVDRKVPRAERADLPIVADATGRIVWVAGHVIAEDFRVTPAASDVVILKLKYWRHGT